MNFIEGIMARGQLSIIKTNALGVITESIYVPNLVVDIGKAFIASRVIGTPTVMSNMAIGTGTVAPAAADTTLGIEAGRVALSSISSTAAVITHTATFPAGTGTGAITEAGIFNAASAGTMIARTTFPVVNKATGDTLAISWTITIS